VRVIAGLVLAAVLLVPGATREESLLPSPPTPPPPSHRAETVSKTPQKRDQKPSPTGVRAKSTRFRVYARPSVTARSRVSRALNPIDQRLVLLVRQTRTGPRGRWFEVFLPERPNGSKGWVRARAVDLVRLRQHIKIDLSERSLTYSRRGDRTRHFRVAVGTPTTPTPTGTFYVWARVPQTSPQGPYGVYALGLSGFSVLSEWPGGGRVAIHGTPDPSDTGAAVSHGCVRVYNADMRQLMGVRMGTPVIIRA
jgi:lipoprotein-anchoring transpeptidase ErfK/SrfK